MAADVQFAHARGNLVFITVQILSFITRYYLMQMQKKKEAVVELTS